MLRAASFRRKASPKSRTVEVEIMGHSEMTIENTLGHGSHAATDHGDADHHHDHKPQGFLNRWLFTTNHKDIGTLYLVFSLVMFLIGGAMAMVIRAELFMPGLQLVEPEFFNQMTTMHALI